MSLTHRSFTSNSRHTSRVSLAHGRYVPCASRSGRRAKIVQTCSKERGARRVRFDRPRLFGEEAATL
eukprot:3787121-Rhodomonas_salina.1